MKMLEKSMRLRITALVVGVLAAVGLLMVVLYDAQPAEATFPGKNGKIAYLVFGRHGNEIFTIKPSGRGRVQVTHDRMHQEHFSFSPNGKKIAYSAPDIHSEEIYGTADEEIYTMNVGGGSRFQVTNNNREDNEPSYSPDGKKIAYMGRDEICTISVRGGGKSIVVTEGGELSWLSRP